MRQRFFFILALLMMLTNTTTADACTGITLRSADGRTVVARTIEWGGSNLKSSYVVVPRGHTQFVHQRQKRRDEIQGTLRICGTGRGS